MTDELQKVKDLLFGMDYTENDGKRLIAITKRLLRRAETAESKLIRLTAELAGLKDKMRWIPVGERLPDNNDDVLVWRVEGYHEIGCHSSGLWWGGTFMDEAIYITHWMPLPEPPEVEND